MLRTSRRSLRLLCGLALAAVSAASPTARFTPVVGPAVVAAFPAEVRIRKLHLVRPDLIPYPIDFEVYC